MQQVQINSIINEAEELEARARALRQNAGDAKMDRIKSGGIEEWLDVSFQSSSGLTEEFALFAKQYKKAIAKAMGDYELVSFSRGHFYMSGFFRSPHTGKLVYFSTDDVRGSNNGWFDNILIRTAQHDKDYTGGSNCFSSLENIRDRADDLTA
jgi:hypothetical protein